jgi:DnaK suppressor protein
MATNKNKAVKKKVVKKKAPTKKKVSAKKKVTTQKKVVKKKAPAKKKVSTKKKVAPQKKVVKKKAPAKKKVDAKKKVAAKNPSKPVKKTATKQVKSKKVEKISSVEKKTKVNKANLKPGKLRLAKQDLPKLDPAVLKIRERLIANRSELMKLIRSSQSIEREAGDVTFSNEIDLASNLEGREMTFQLSSRDRNELKLIEDTLFRINSGTYGECESCEKKISLKRLQIMPLTALCIECQEAAENL